MYRPVRGVIDLVRMKMYEFPEEAEGKSYVESEIPADIADAVHALHGAREDPGVAALHRLVAAGLEDERSFHFFLARGCAAS